MSYLLDTNHCIYLKNAFFKRPDRRNTFEEHTLNCFQKVNSTQEPVLISSVSLGEMYFGAEKSEHKEKNYKKINFLRKYVVLQELDEVTWKLFAITKAELFKSGKGITDFDLLIACAAQAHGHVLVSNDNDHKVIPKNFLLANWAIPP